MNVHNITAYNDPKLKTIQRPTEWQINEQNMAYLYNEMLFAHK